jgi:hypothetical protein
VGVRGKALLVTIGHIRKRGERWYYVHRADDPETGRRRQIWKGGFTTREAAEQALREALTDLETGSWKAPTNVSYASYVNGIWLPHLAERVERSTLDAYARDLRAHVLPMIGAVRLQKLTAAHLSALYRSLGDDSRLQPDNTNRRHSLECYQRIRELRRDGASYGEIATQIAREMPGERHISRAAVARIVARAGFPLGPSTTSTRSSAARCARPSGSATSPATRRSTPHRVGCPRRESNDHNGRRDTDVRSSLSPTTTIGWKRRSSTSRPGAESSA